MWYCSSETRMEKAALGDCLAKMENAFSNTDFTAEELEVFLNNVEN
jgi:hypothetical protein